VNASPAPDDGGAETSSPRSDGAPGDAPIDVTPGGQGPGSVAQSWMISPTVSAELKDMATDGTHVILALRLFGDVELGGSTVTAPYENVSLVSYDTAGSYAWHRIFDAVDLESVEIETDASGNTYVAGRASSVTFDVRLASPGSPIWFLAKLSPTGNPIWSKAYRVGRAIGNSSNPRLGVDAQGNVFLSAAVGFDGVDFGPGAQLGPGAPPGAGTLLEAFLVKFDPQASPLWIRKFENFNGYGVPYFSLGVDPSGASVVSTVTYGAVDLGGYTNDCPPLSKCVTAAGFDAMGNRSWIHQWPGSPNDNVVGLPRVTVSQGSTFLTGLGSIDFGRGTRVPDSNFHTRLDSAGAPIWTGFSKVLPAGGQEVSALAPSGAAHVAGGFSRDVTIGSTTLSNSNPNSTAVYVAEYDPTGSLRYARRLGATETAFAGAIVVTASGPVVAGGFYGSVELDRTFQTRSQTGDGSVYVARLAQ
jgi:hypothetical protein